MKIISGILNFLTILHLLKSSEADVRCENVQDIGEKCLMQSSTSIREYGVTIWNRGDSIKELNFSGNRNIFFLPVYVGYRFPNMKIYNARYCSIKTISKTNFQYLYSLTHVYLMNNQIEALYMETFEGLDNLEVIWFGEIGNFKL